MSTVTDKGEIEELSLDTTLDDIEDLPGFNLPPTGAYRVIIDKADGERVINEKKAIQFDFKIEETVEMTEALEEGETGPKPGDMFGMMWFRNNKFAMGRFKEFAVPLAQRLGVKSLGEVVSQSPGMQLLMVVTRKPDKKDKDILRLQIKRCAVL